MKKDEKNAENHQKMVKKSNKNPTFEYINELWYLALNLSIKLEL